MDISLDSPCVFCDYNGRGYWQKETHNKYCPFYKVGGVEDRENKLRDIVKRHYEYYKE